LASLKSRTRWGCSLWADQSRCTLDLLSPVSLAIVRTLQGPPCGARVRARLKARPTALAESCGLRPRPGASLSPSKPLAAHRFLQRRRRRDFLPDCFRQKRLPHLCDDPPAYFRWLQDSLADGRV
jgi:hypothetical protein